MPSIGPMTLYRTCFTSELLLNVCIAPSACVHSYDSPSPYAPLPSLQSANQKPQWKEEKKAKQSNGKKHSSSVSLSSLCLDMQKTATECGLVSPTPARETAYLCLPHKAKRLLPPLPTVLDSCMCRHPSKAACGGQMRTALLHQQSPSETPHAGRLQGRMPHGLASAARLNREGGNANRCEGQ